jgi:hypothetical protein
VRSEVQALRDTEIGFLKAAETFNFPGFTLLDSLNGAGSEEKHNCFPQLVEKVPWLIKWRLNLPTAAK